MRRRGVTVRHDQPTTADPNVSRPEITVEVRVFWPPAATSAQLNAALEAGFQKAWTEANVNFQGDS